MPIKQASFKSLRQSKKRQARNLKIKKDLLSAVKSARRTVADKKADESKASVGKAIKLLDRAVAKGVVKKNTAARKKSRLMKKLNELNKK